jgi:hypothetical protein
VKTIREIVKDMVDIIPEEKLKKLYETLENIMEEDIDEVLACSPLDNVNLNVA